MHPTQHTRQNDFGKQHFVPNAILAKLLAGVDLAKMKHLFSDDDIRQALQVQGLSCDEYFRRCKELGLEFNSKVVPEDDLVVRLEDYVFNPNLDSLGNAPKSDDAWLRWYIDDRPKELDMSTDVPGVKLVPMSALFTIRRHEGTSDEEYLYIEVPVLLRLHGDNVDAYDYESEGDHLDRLRDMLEPLMSTYTKASLEVHDLDSKSEEDMAVLDWGKCLVMPFDVNEWEAQQKAQES